MTRAAIRIDDWPERTQGTIRVIGGQFAETEDEPTYVDLVDERPPGYAYRLYFKWGGIIELRIGFMTQSTPRAITATDLRHVHLGELQQVAADFLRAAEPHLAPDHPEAASTIAARVNRPMTPAQLMPLVAAMYVEMQGQPKVVQQIATRLGRRVPTVWEYLRNANAEGYLIDYPGPLTRITDKTRCALGELPTTTVRVTKKG